MIEIKLVKGASFTIAYGKGKSQKMVFLKEKPRFFADDHEVVAVVKKQLNSSSESGQKARFAVRSGIDTYLLPMSWENKTSQSHISILTDLSVDTSKMKKPEHFIAAIKEQILNGVITVSDEALDTGLKDVVLKKDHEAKVGKLQEQIDKLVKEGGIETLAFKKLTKELLDRIKVLESKNPAKAG